MAKQTPLKDLDLLLCTGFNSEHEDLSLCLISHEIHDPSNFHFPLKLGVCGPNFAKHLNVFDSRTK